MAYFQLINRNGQHCGTKLVTDRMADHLAGQGWHLIPADGPAIKATPGSKTL